MEALRRALLVCGILATVYYVALNVYVPTRWTGYSVTSQVVSELSAIDAPTRTLWVRAMVPYTILLAALGVGVWMSAAGSRALGAAGGLLVANAAAGHFWPPMHMRGIEPTLTDTLHVAWAMVWLAAMLATMGIAAARLGPRFRAYTIATLVVFVVFGVLTGVDSPALATDLPTPWIGLWERINMAAGMAWLAVLAAALLGRRETTASSRRS
jgi:hypothetical protein